MMGMGAMGKGGMPMPITGRIICIGPYWPRYWHHPPITEIGICVIAGRSQCFSNLDESDKVLEKLKEEVMLFMKDLVKAAECFFSDQCQAD